MPTTAEIKRADKRRKAKNAYERERRRLHRLHAFEYAARDKGLIRIAGVDEVGRGPLAGPVVAACVVMREPLLLPGLNDSKQVTKESRDDLAVQIKNAAADWAVGVASVEEINRINIYWASVLAMERAIAALTALPDYLITDAVRIRSFTGLQEPLIKGDARSAVVAAASIVAKVYRDGLLEELDREDPRYGFAEHKGYATLRHITALKEHGPCVHHRSGFWRVKDAQIAFGFVTSESTEVNDDAHEDNEYPAGA